MYSQEICNVYRAGQNAMPSARRSEEHLILCVVHFLWLFRGSSATAYGKERQKICLGFSFMATPPSYGSRGAE